MNKTILSSLNMNVGAIFFQDFPLEDPKNLHFDIKYDAKNRLFKLQRIVEPPTTCFHNAHILQYYYTQNHLI